MEQTVSDRSIVQRLGAERYLLITLVSFAGSVILTRLFLQLTGYPQIGNSTLHIAHVLWGGLLLFISGLLLLVLANAWAYTLSAVLNGAGMGLFIDEVGKFITQTNDYFYAPAAPIIYAFFLLTVLLYTYLRRPARNNPRGMMYQVLHDLGEVIDHDLQPGEKEQMSNQLKEVIQAAPASNLSLLGQSLLDFLETESLFLTEQKPRWQQKIAEKQALFRQRMCSSPVAQRNFRLALAALLMVSGSLVVTRLILISFNMFIAGEINAWVIDSLRIGRIASPGGLRWSFVRIFLEGGFGLLTVVAGAFLIVRREMLGARLAAISLVMQLTTVNLLVFYLDQFSAVVSALAEFGLLLLVLVYRKWYLEEENR